MPMSNTRHAFPRTRGDASLYVRPLPALVPGRDAERIDEFLGAVCKTFSLRLGETGYGEHPPPFTKTVQWATQRLLYAAGVYISLKDIRVQRGMTRPKSCVVAIRPARRFAQAYESCRRHPDWLAFATVFIAPGDVTFKGDVRVNTEEHLSSDVSRSQLRDILESHLLKSTNKMPGERVLTERVDCAYNAITVSAFLSNECQSLYSDNVGGHYLRQRISYVCRQMSVTPHAWKGSRFVHSYNGESATGTSFMWRMRELNDLLNNNVIQLHELDGWPPLALTADYFQSQCNRLQEVLKSCKSSIERDHPVILEGDAARLERQLSDGPEAESTIQAVESYAAMRNKGLKIKAVLDNAQSAHEDSGACLWTHH